MPDSARTLAVAGASSWIGQRVCRELAADGWRVTAVCRPKNAFLMERLGVEVADLSTLTGRHFDAVVNLAYPSDPEGGDAIAANRRIFRQICHLAGAGARVLHIGTVAVFGMALDHPVTAGLLRPRHDHEYVTSKIQMERWLDAEFGDGSLDIVRLGNVWGPGSANWVVGLTEALLAGLPVRVTGRDGFSNVTDVANVTSYICHVLRSPAPTGTRFHHLAELGHHRWGRFVSFLAATLEQEVKEVAFVPPEHASLFAEFRSILVRTGIERTRADLRAGRYTGSIYRSLRHHSPTRLLRWFKEAKPQGPPEMSCQPTLTQDQVGLLRLLANENQFAPEILEGWSAPVTLDESLSRVHAWLGKVGYIPR